MINQLKIKDKIEGWRMIHKIWVWGLIRKNVAKKASKKFKNGQSFNQKQEKLISGQWSRERKMK